MPSPFGVGSISPICAFYDLKSIETLSLLKLDRAYAALERHCRDVPKEASSVDAVPAIFSLHHFFLFCFGFYFLQFPFVAMMEAKFLSPLLKGSISTRILYKVFIILTVFKEP